jgi:phage recombination protein Bet
MSDLAVREPSAVIERGPMFTPEQVQLIKRQLLTPRDRQATDDELALFLYQCERTRLDPFHRQIYGVFRWDGRTKAERMVVQVSIDGLRLIAERTGKYLGQTAAVWTGANAGDEWVDVWRANSPPFAAKVGVWKLHAKEPTFGVAVFREYAPTDSKGNISGLWPKMPANMIAKCAEALALRRAFPAETSGLYTAEEMAQADAPSPAVPDVSLDDVARHLPADVEGTASEPTREDVSAMARASAPAPAPPAGAPEVETPADRSPDDLMNESEIRALVELMAATDTSPGFVRMHLIGEGVENVGELDELLPKLTVAQGFSVIDAIKAKS